MQQQILNTTQIERVAKHIIAVSKAGYDDGDQSFSGEQNIGGNVYVAFFADVHYHTEYLSYYGEEQHLWIGTDINVSPVTVKDYGLPWYEQNINVNASKALTEAIQERVSQLSIYLHGKQQGEKQVQLPF